MKKRLMMVLAAVMCVATVVAVTPSDVKAMYPCSQDIINDANAQISSAQAAYNVALANEKAALDNYNAVKAAGGSELQVTVAANAYTTAQAQSKWYLDQVNNAKAYLANITGRAALETAFQEEREVLGTLTKLQEAKAEYERAQGQVTNVANQIQNVQAGIASYQQLALSNPGFQAQVNELTAQLNALQADLAAKQAVANNLKAAYDAKVAAGGYAYAPVMEDYWQKRDNARNHSANCECDTCRMLNPEKFAKIDADRAKWAEEQAKKKKCK